MRGCFALRASSARMTTRWCASRAAFAKITCLAAISTSSWSRGASPESLAEACRWWIRLEPALAQPRLTAALGRVIATLGGGRHCSRQCTLASCSACRTRMRKLWNMGGFSGGWPKRGRWPGRWRVTPPRADPARLRGLVDAAISPTSAAWSLRLSVRTSGFQPGKRGSTPLGTASGLSRLGITALVGVDAPVQRVVAAYRGSVITAS